jgi:hypothetical protein
MSARVTIGTLWPAGRRPACLQPRTPRPRPLSAHSSARASPARCLSPACASSAASFCDLCLIGPRLVGPCLAPTRASLRPAPHWAVFVTLHHSTQAGSALSLLARGVGDPSRPAEPPLSPHPAPDRAAWAFANLWANQHVFARHAAHPVRLPAAGGPQWASPIWALTGTASPTGFPTRLFNVRIRPGTIWPSDGDRPRLATPVRCPILTAPDWPTEARPLNRATTSQRPVRNRQTALPVPAEWTCTHEFAGTQEFESRSASRPRSPGGGCGSPAA